MSSFKSVAAAALLLASTATAHFTLTTPPTIGFEDKSEGTGPCGGFTPDFSDKSKLVDFHVGGEPVGVQLGHSQANWLFRGTLDETAAGNWTQLFPIVQQSGLGFFCESAIPAPEEWVGKQGVVGIVANAVDGLLYQCAAVNFVAGTGTVESTCKNGSIQASFVPDSALSALVGSDSDSDANTTSPSPSTPASQTPSSSPSPSASGNAAAGLGPAVGGLVAAVGLGLFGLAL
ncbi:hypothetical protein GE09DRAFT_1230871 [Coniochaeta sp. 2T2.1]|nr:hypothetical protein GE09DRAFT_1230871 [Coniochaeta sp. 2T2.1]